MVGVRERVLERSLRERPHLAAAAVLTPHGRDDVGPLAAALVPVLVRGAVVAFVGAAAVVGLQHRFQFMIQVALLSSLSGRTSLLADPIRAYALIFTEENFAVARVSFFLCSDQSSSKSQFSITKQGHH